MPSLPPWNSSQRWSMWALIRPTASPSRSQRKSSASACSNQGFLDRSRNWRRSKRSGGTHWGSFGPQPVWDLDELLQIGLPLDRPDRAVPSPGATYTCVDERDRPRARGRVREGAHPRPARAARDRQAGRPPPLLPGAHLRGRARWSRWRGARRSCSAPTTTSGSPATRGSSRRPATRSRPTAPGSPARACSTGPRRFTSSSSASSPSGWAPRRRSSSPPATRRTSAASAPSSAPATR